MPCHRATVLTETQALQLGQGGRGTELVEDVVVPLCSRLWEEQPGHLRAPKCPRLGTRDTLLSQLDPGGAQQPLCSPETHLEGDAGLLQQVGFDGGPSDTGLAEANLDVLPKAAAVVVPGRLCVPKGLAGGIRWPQTSRCSRDLQSPPPTQVTGGNIRDARPPEAQGQPGTGRDPPP